MLDIVSLGYGLQGPLPGPSPLITQSLFFPALDSVSEGLGELFLIYYH